MKKHIANIITAGRIFCSICMLFLPAFSPGFYMLYLVCGFSDMVDGTIARKTGSAGSLGETLDTAADFVFLAASAIKLLPHIRIPVWLWLWICAIAILKIINIVRGCLASPRIILPHTFLNKLAGLMLFLFPLMMNFIDLQACTAAVCLVATLSAMQESLSIHK